MRVERIKGAMRRPLVVFGLMFTATIAAAAPSQQAPDYSRETILKILHSDDVENAPFKFDIGQVEYRTKNMRYRFAYLPLLAPLPYTGPHGAGQLPNPFVLTHTEFAWQPHQYVATPDDWEQSREYKREYRRVAKMLAKF